MKQFVLGLIVAVALALSVGPHAVSADPTNHPRATPVTVTCNGVEYTIIGPGTAGLIVGSTAVSIPSQFQFMVSYVDPATSELVEFTEVSRTGQGKRTGQQGSLTTCTFSETFFDPELGAQVTVNIVVTQFMTPRGGR